MEFCEQCGQGNVDDASFCVQCGAPLRSANQATSGEAPQTTTSPPSAPMPIASQSGESPPNPPAGPPGQMPLVTGTPPAPSPLMPASPPAYPQYHAPLPTDGMAVAALVLGVASFFICPLVGAVLAVIFGYMARSNIHNSNGTLGGEGLATAGIILGFIHLGLLLLVVAIILIVVLIAGTSTNGGIVIPALLATFGLI